MRQTMRQRGLTLIELLLAAAIGAVLLVALSSVVKLGLDAQRAQQAAADLAYQGHFALTRMADRARSTAPKVLTTPAANTSGDWFAPAGCSGASCLMYCRNPASNNLIETTTADVTCSGTTVIAANVTAFSAQLPAGTGAVDRRIGQLSLTLVRDASSLTLSSSVRLGGGTL